MLISFKQLLLDEMTKEDLDYLASAAMMDPDMDEQIVYGRMAVGELLPWRVETDKGNSLILLEIKQRKQDRILFVLYVAGKGFVGNGKFVIETLVEFAKLHNCTAIESQTNMQLAKYLKCVGFKIERCTIRKEITNG